MPPRSRSARAAAADDRGMQVLELKLSILISGPGQRRNPALDVLTGRIPDERIVTLQAGLTTRDPGDAPRQPTVVTLPVAAIKMAAVARSSKPSPSPWLQSSTATERPKLRLVAPPEPTWTRIPVVSAVVSWAMTVCRLYTSREHSPRVRPAS